MKKVYIILILSFSLLLTGCFGLTGKGYLTNTCTKDETSTSLIEHKKYVINFKSGVVNTVKFSNSYESNNGSDISFMQDTLESYKELYNSTKGVSVDLSLDSLTINYEFDISNMKEDTMDRFLLKSSYNDQISILKENGYTCK